MTTRWRAWHSRHGCLLAGAFACSLARAESFTFTVHGSVIGAASRGDHHVGLYAEKSSTKSGPIMAESTTKSNGNFELISHIGSQRLRDKNLWVVCRPKGDVACRPHQLGAADFGTKHKNLTTAKVDLACNATTGDSPATMARGIAALALTHEVLVWAGVERPAAADAALQIAVARADETLGPEERETFKTALASAAAPLRAGLYPELTPLPSLRRDDFAAEMLAAAPSWRWLSRLESDDLLPAPYGERDGRFEGSVVHRVGAAFDALASVSEGPLSVDPETQSSLKLAWPASGGSRLCLEVRPTVPETGWHMRKVVAAGGVAFTWDLAAARKAGVKKGTLGAFARPCADADRGQGVYIPVRAGDSAAKADSYRLVFLFRRQLTNLYLDVFQGEGASRRAITLPDGALHFNRDEQTPTVTIDIPISSLHPGVVELEMSGRGPGRFGPERVSFLHAQRTHR